MRACVCVCVRARVCACACVCVRACVWMDGCMHACMVNVYVNRLRFVQYKATYGQELVFTVVGNK